MFLRERLTETATLRLKVYPIVILQLASIGLILSLSAQSGAVAVDSIAEAPQAKVEVQAAPSAPVPTEVKSENYQPITDPQNVKKFVNHYFADIPLLARVASCESHYRQYNKKGEVLRGEVNRFDVGVMQINELYHRTAAEKLGLDIDTIEGNVAYARYLYEKKGAQPWISSSACWAKVSQSEIARS